MAVNETKTDARSFVQKRAKQARNWPELQKQLCQRLPFDPKDSSRGKAIVAHAHLEGRLRLLLGKALPGAQTSKGWQRLFEAGGIFYYGRRIADGCFALGLIGEDMLGELKQIAKIRNCFAHDREIDSFDHPDITKFCKKLFLPDILNDTMPHEALQPENRFTDAVSMLDWFLEVEASVVVQADCFAKDEQQLAQDTDKSAEMPKASP